MRDQALPPRLLYRVPEAAKALGYSRAKTYALISQGLLPCVRLGGKSVRIPVDALEEWVHQNIQAPTRQGS